MKVMLKATFDGRPLYAEPDSPAARAYGIAVCIHKDTWARFIPVRFK